MNKQNVKKQGTFSRLLGVLFRYYKIHLIVVLVCLIMASISSTVVAVFIQQLIDKVITPGLQTGMASVMGELVKIILTLGAIYALGLIANFVYTRLMAVVTQGSLRYFRTEMFGKMETLPIKYFDTNAHGDIMSTYTNDVDAIRQMIGQSIPVLIQVIFQFVVTVAIMLYYSLWLTLLVLISIVLMLILVKYYGAGSVKYMTEQQKALAKTEGYAEEMLGGQKVIQVFCHEEENKKAFDELNEHLFKMSDKAYKLAHNIYPILNNLSYLLYIVIAIVGCIMVYFNLTNVSLVGVNAITIGAIVSFLGMARQLSGSLGDISTQIPMISMGIAGADRIFKLIDEEKETDEGYVTLVKCSKNADGGIKEDAKAKDGWAWKSVDGATGEATYTELKGDVRFEHVNFGYVEGKTVLHDVSLFAKPGQKIAFVGATGAGKTTITNLINRFYDISDGTITYDGIDIGSIAKPDLRKSLGIVLQDVNLFTGTVMDNIRYGRLDATDEECIEAAKLANADDFITRLPEGYDTMLTGDGASLSQGQKQLISIARAAVADPPVMILDEATSSIDTRTEALVQAGMDNLMKGRTVFVIAHRLSTVYNSNAIMVLDHGNIIERGSHDDLIAQKGTYYQLYTGAFELE